MQRVQMFAYRKRIEVDADQVKLHEQKDAAVNKATYLNDQARKGFLNATGKDELHKTMAKIQRLNKRIRQNVTFPA